MKRPLLAVMVMILAAGCGGGKGKQAAMSCEIGGDKSKADLATLESGKTYDVAVRTNKGDFTIELATKTSPCTTASFVGLVQKGFFNGLIFHRIVPGFVIQGGDPSGNGSGGPGYSTVDTPPSDAQYTKGVVAMAKTGTDPAGTAGSQFFVVTGEDSGLTPDYAILGKVTSGLDVVEKIGRLGNAQQQPTERVEIKDMAVTTR